MLRERVWRSLTGVLPPTPAAALVGVTLGALALRLFRIDAQSAWYDEAFTISLAGAPWHEMMDTLVRDFNHPPLHTVLVRWWFGVVGFGVAQARVLSALAGAAAVPALYWLGSLLFERRSALFAAFLLAISQLGIWLSQEARGYSLLLLLTIVAAALYVRACRGGRAIDFGLFVATAIVALYTHYYALFALAALGTDAAIYRRQSAIPATWWGVALVAVSIAYLPWLSSGVVEAALQNPSGASVGGERASLAAPLYALNWFNNGKLAGVRHAAPLWVSLVGVAIFTAPALYALRRGVADAQERRVLVLLMLLSVLPVLGAWLLGLAGAVHRVRHAFAAVAPYYLLVARGVAGCDSRTLRRLFPLGVVAFTAFSLRAVYYVPHKENYRDALQAMAVAVRPDDCAILGAPNGTSDAGLYWAVYQPGRSLPPPVETGEAGRRVDCQRIWVFWDRTAWHQGPLTWGTARQAIGSAYRETTRSSFLDVDLYLLERWEH